MVVVIILSTISIAVLRPAARASHGAAGSYPRYVLYTLMGRTAATSHVIPGHLALWARHAREASTARVARHTSTGGDLVREAAGTPGEATRAPGKSSRTDTVATAPVVVIVATLRRKNNKK